MRWLVVTLSIPVVVFLLLGYVIQNLIIYPMESWLRPYESVQLYSLCYLPHGFKAIAFGILGGWAIIPSILSQTLGGTLVYGDDPYRAIEGALIGVGCFTLSLMSFNFYRKASLFTKIISFEFSDSNRLLNILLFAFWATLVNAIISNVYWGAAEDYLFLKFALGDVIGAFFAVSMLIILRHLIYEKLKGYRK
jgi:hypothetical protein